MSPIDCLLVQAALRQVELALSHLADADGDGFNLGVFSAKLDLVCARSDLKAALVGNLPTKETV